LFKCQFAFSEAASAAPVEYYRFDVDQSNLTDGEVWSVWLDEWEMHGNLGISMNQLSLLTSME